MKRTKDFSMKGMVAAPPERVCDCCGRLHWRPGYAVRCVSCELAAHLAQERARRIGREHAA